MTDKPTESRNGYDTAPSGKPRTPEQAKALREFREKIGQSLVANLNANVLRDNPDPK